MLAEFKENPEWSKEVVSRVSRKTGLLEAQVYKWGWEQKRKKGTDGKPLALASTDEFGGYSKLGFSELDCISASIGIDLNAKLRELHLELEIEVEDLEDEYEAEKQVSIGAARSSGRKRRAKENAKRKTYQNFKGLVE